jgi:hypothetical protein
MFLGINTMTLLRYSWISCRNIWLSKQTDKSVLFLNYTLEIVMIQNNYIFSLFSFCLFNSKVIGFKIYIFTMRFKYSSINKINIFVLQRLPDNKNKEYILRNANKTYHGFWRAVILPDYFVNKY